MSRQRGGVVRRRRHVTAKDLAAMGFCEKRVLLTHQLGERNSRALQQDMRRGLAAHRRYYEQGAAASSRDRCVVATCVFGDAAPQTEVLRRYRDVVLLPQSWGRLAISIYYRFAPAACKALRRSPLLAGVTRAVLDAAVARCHSALRSRGHEC